MALCQRSASRFFAAFYRWNRYAHTCPKYTVATCICRQTIEYRRHPPRSSTFTTSTSLQQSQNTAQVPTRELYEDNDTDASKVIEDPEGVSSPDNNVETMHSEERVAEGITLAEYFQRHPQVPSVKKRDDLAREAQIASANRPAVLPQATIALGEDIAPAVRKAMRNMPQSVVVITAAAAGHATTPAPLGSVVSSFNTVSLNPPTISFNLKFPSRTLDAIKHNDGHFSVHFLANDPRASQIAQLFTIGNDEDKLEKRAKALSSVLYQPARNNKDGNRATKIHDETVAAIMHCKMTQSYPVADHVIVVAKVVGVEAKDHSKSLLLYSQGQYAKLSQISPLCKTSHKTTMNGTDLRFPSPDPKEHVLWSKPVAFPQYDRKKLRNELLAFVKRNPQLFERPNFRARRDICALLAIPFDPFGIRLGSIVIEAAQEAGHTPRASPVEMELPPYSDLEGPLTAHDRDTVVERSIKLIRNDPLFLAMDYEHFFYLVGMSPFSNGNSVLASDILDPLRREGLVAPFHPCEGPINLYGSKTQLPTLEIFEQAEHRLRQHFLKLTHTQSVSANLDKLMNEVNGSGQTTAMIKFIQTRLLVEVFPEIYNPSNFNFSGHLTLAESRIAVSRILQHFSSPHEESIRLCFINIDHEVLRHCKIHPFTTSSSVNLYDLVAKLRYWFRNLTFSDFRRRLAATKNSMTSTTVSSAALEKRADRLVKGNPKRLPHWKEADLQTALAVGPKTRVDMGNAKFQRLDWSDVTRALHDAIYKNYEDFTPEERWAVDTFIQDTAKELSYSPQARHKPSLKIIKYNSVDTREAVEEANLGKLQKTQKMSSDDLVSKVLARIGEDKEVKSQHQEEQTGKFTAYGFNGQKNS